MCISVVYTQVYKAETRDKPMKVYNLWYSKSLESDRYMATLNRENTVFEDLIQQKAFMVFPEVAQVRFSLLSCIVFSFTVNAVLSKISVFMLKTN